jgi:hypothetical protein
MPRVIPLSHTFKRKFTLKLDKRELPVVMTIYPETQQIGFRKRRSKSHEEFVLPLSQVYSLVMKSGVRIVRDADTTDATADETPETPAAPGTLF